MDCQTGEVAPIFKRRGPEGVLQLLGNQTVILSLSGKTYVKLTVPPGHLPLVAFMALEKNPSTGGLSIPQDELGNHDEDEMKETDRK